MGTNVCYKSYVDVDVICPYYKGLDGNGRILLCEGLIGHSVTSSRFRTDASRARHMEGFCNTFDYDRCPICQALNTKYA